MKRLFLGLIITFCMVSVFANADTTGAVAGAIRSVQGTEVSALLNALKIQDATQAKVAFSKAFPSGVIPGAALANFRVLHSEVYSNSVPLADIQAAAEKYNLSSMSDVQRAMGSLNGKSLTVKNLENVSFKSSYTAKLDSSRATAVSSIPGPRTSSTAPAEEAGFFALGLTQGVALFGENPEMKAVLATTVNCGSTECRANASVLGQMVSALNTTACVGISDPSCPALAKSTTQRYFQLVIVPALNQGHSSVVTSRLIRGILHKSHLNAQQAKLGDGMALYQGMDRILEQEATNPGSSLQGPLKECLLGTDQGLVEFFAAA